MPDVILPTHPTTGDRLLDDLLDVALVKSLAHDCLTIEQLGQLLGDDPREAWRGRHADRLCNSARDEVLVTTEAANWIEYRDDAGRVTARRVREQLGSLLVRRADFVAWLTALGTAQDQRSRAATWARAG